MFIALIGSHLFFIHCFLDVKYLSKKPSYEYGRFD